MPSGYSTKTISRNEVVRNCTKTYLYWGRSFLLQYFKIFCTKDFLIVIFGDIFHLKRYNLGIERIFGVNNPRVGYNYSDLSENGEVPP